MPPKPEGRTCHRCHTPIGKGERAHDTVAGLMCEKCWAVHDAEVQRRVQEWRDLTRREEARRAGV